MSGFNRRLKGRTSNIRALQLRLSPGDVLVVLIKGLVPMYEIEQVSRTFGKAFPHNQVVVAPETMRFVVIGDEHAGSSELRQ